MVSFKVFAFGLILVTLLVTSSCVSENTSRTFSAHPASQTSTTDSAHPFAAASTSTPTDSDDVVFDQGFAMVEHSEERYRRAFLHAEAKRPGNKRIEHKREALWNFLKEDTVFFEPENAGWLNRSAGYFSFDLTLHGFTKRDCINKSGGADLISQIYLSRQPEHFAIAAEQVFVGRIVDDYASQKVLDGYRSSLDIKVERVIKSRYRQINKGDLVTVRQSSGPSSEGTYISVSTDLHPDSVSMAQSWLFFLSNVSYRYSLIFPTHMAEVIDTTIARDDLYIQRYSSYVLDDAGSQDVIASIENSLHKLKECASIGRWFQPFDQ